MFKKMFWPLLFIIENLINGIAWFCGSSYRIGLELDRRYVISSRPFFLREAWKDFRKDKKKSFLQRFFHLAGEVKKIYKAS